MAAYYGVKGVVSLGTNDSNIRGWKLNTSRSIHDTTVFDTSGNPKYTTKIGGHISWSGSFEGFSDDTNLLTMADFDGVPIAISLTDGDNNTYTGNVLLSNTSMENDHNDVAKFTSDFEGTDTLTVTAV